MVIVHNEASKIGDCIKSLRQLTDDIVVVDSFSTGATVHICNELNVRVFQQKWLGYSQQKNFGNAQAQHDWVISIDADERISGELAIHIQQIFEQEPKADAYNLDFLTHFCGKAIHFGGWNPESHVRIFNKKIINWNTDAVHEGLTLQPQHKIEKLRGKVLHYTVGTPQAYMDKTEKYSSLFAEKSKSLGKKASFWKIYLSPITRFIKEYCLKLGFLDGKEGLFIAKENARYTYLKYLKMK